ncbi:TolC family protein [Nitrosophilus kaiyonis]|uniref:TolC family protein n=1 Tax=Nitrosophilus kaiyonis TaxID=2930200 RepID=UPI0024929EEC|nr:TolC family protein [Nitrosophilus kaiyonis]
MRYSIILFLFFSATLFGEDYFEIIKKVDNSLTIKRANYLVKSAKKMLKAKEGKNLFSIDASLQAVRLKETPTMYMHMPLTPTSALQVGKKDNFQGEISLTYPLFSGFAITSLIDKERLNYERAKLQKMDIKRNLYLQTTKLYSAIFSLKEALKAQKKAKEAINLALKKAEAFYEKGLIAPSEVYNIEAKKYDIDAQIIKTKSEIKKLLNTLSYLLNSKIKDIENLIDIKIPNREKLIDTALNQREDILSIKKALLMDKMDEKIIKSKFYPQIALTLSFKKQGDSLRLNGDGYTNADKSYIGAVIKYNIFNGFSDKNTLEAAKIKTLAKTIELNDYKERVKNDIKNAYIDLNALKIKLLSIKAEVKSRREYFKLTLGRFENQLSSADELSRSIADLAAAKAKEAAVKSDIFNQKAKIYLLGGLNYFEKNF